MNRDIKVLVVDESQTMRRIVRTMLKDLGFHDIEEAADGKEALLRLADGDFGLVVSDLNMPNLDGLGMLKAIRAEARTATLPVLMVTGESNREYVVQAARAGVNGYVLKPFTAATFEQRLERIFVQALPQAA